MENLRSRIYFIGILLLLSLLIFTNVSNTASNVSIYIDEVEVTFNNEVGYPVIENGRTSVPVRIISENMGYEVNWNAEDKIVSISNSTNEIKLPINSLNAEVDGKTVAIDSKAYISNSRTYVPIRFISETLGAGVRYSKNNGRSIIRIYTGKPGIVITPKEEPKPVEGKNWIKPDFLSVKYGDPQIPIKLYVNNNDSYKGKGVKLSTKIVGDYSYLNKYKSPSIFEQGTMNIVESSMYYNIDASQFQEIFALYLPPGSVTMDGKQIKLPKSGDIIMLQVTMTQKGKTQEYTIPFKF